MKAAVKSRGSVVAAQRSRAGQRRPALSPQAALSLILRFENPGQLTVPNQLSLGADGRLYLTRSAEGTPPQGQPQLISLRESVAWFRLGHECHMPLTEGEKFGHWLKSIEQALR
jgi:hypothetical protein